MRADNTSKTSINVSKCCTESCAATTTIIMTKEIIPIVVTTFARLSTGIGIRVVHGTKAFV